MFPLPGTPNTFHSEFLQIVPAARRWFINRQTARDPQLMCLVRQIVIACLSYNTCFRVKHIPGKSNVVADFTSRLQVERPRLVQPCLYDLPTIIPIQWLPWHATPLVSWRFILHRVVLVSTMLIGPGLWHLRRLHRKIFT